MYKAEYSYWLNVTGQEKNEMAIRKQIRESEGLDAFRMSASANEAGKFFLSYDLGDRGTILEDTNNIVDAVLKLSERFPDVYFSLDAFNEEDKSEGCLIEIKNGVETRRFRRALDPDEYDDVTITTVIDILSAAGDNNGAELIRKYFYKEEIA